MAFDIYGNDLRRGHCEVHPTVHEEYPCRICVSESNRRRPMTQAEKDSEAGKVGTVDPLVSQVVDAIKTGGWNRELATRIIAMVREHDALQAISKMETTTEAKA